ncbi:ornithine carbamoyltransferase [Anaerobacillus alkalidiazotrophicus]|uniref:Ornithine carbamoyltransferase n=1 Tax=Anaerobacillus alkalidiazotrophicus TaxID=472963 RepID=A0A1S2M5P2_9BACI|nr:ornithine carbamoyltransferase [Anaerobacillus alkalidiazotrophicus]OIJ18465.1 ornithine carbamoyltransferase [Anaerobacillus alkalidiazotrophicus]OIJ19944.1 ornithine carbamoyltransferase [Anaerobacillus alkalidiazotrophicus]
MTALPVTESGLNIEKYKGKNLLTLLDYSSEEIKELLEFSVLLKKYQKEGVPHPLLAGKTLAMIFEKSSTRTRVSFEVGMNQLGGSALFLSSKDSQLGRGEPISDTAQVLSRYVDGIMIRTHGHEIIEELAKFSTIPVINALTEDFHPCQALADILTIYEVKGTFEGIKTVYVGDGNNVAHSFLIACAKVGMDVAIATPKGYEAKDWIMKEIEAICNETGAKLLVTNDPVEAVSGADVIYTDVWTSMGHEEETAKRLEAFNEFQVNKALASHAKDDYIFLHCLPAHRGEEVTVDVIDGEHSYIFDQAENRLHAQKAVLVALMGDTK